MPIVDTYRHLGVKLHAATTMMPELRHRAAHAWSAFRQGRTRVFRSKRVSLAKRGLLLATHVLTRLLYAAGAWPPLRKGEYSFFFRTVLAMYRQTLAIPYDGDQHLTQATICTLVQQPGPEALLHVERARYILQLVQSAPLQLWALLRRDAAAVDLFCGTLRWLFAWVRDTSNLGDPISSWEDWESLMLKRPAFFKALVKRARGLEIVRVACFASLQAVCRALAQAGGGDLPTVECCMVTRPLLPSSSLTRRGLTVGPVVAFMQALDGSKGISLPPLAAASHGDPSARICSRQWIPTCKPLPRGSLESSPQSRRRLIRQGTTMDFLVGCGRQTHTHKRQSGP